MLVWEDALLAGLVRVADGHVMLTRTGESAVESRKIRTTSNVY